MDPVKAYEDVGVHCVFGAESLRRIGNDLLEQGSQLRGVNDRLSAGQSILYLGCRGKIGRA